ncbi:MAG: bifunctional chorismate mutase/prephenate dehydratase [Ruminococcaceae bacterium]|nr:bifunctional chorismate mutase/prephenate dehydratase [Oscillospiraceae bacterium]
MNSLDEARKIINEVDAKMAELFCKRMRAAEMVAAYKKEHGLKIFDAAREEEVVRRNSALVEDKELREYYVNFLKNNMAVSRNYQDRLMSGMKIAYCGTEGAFAHIATAKLFPTATKIAYGDFLSAYKAVEEGVCDAAVLPVENSYNGEVGQVTDLMFSGPLYINSITELAVSHDLLAAKDASLSDIRQVISHPQALGQCAEYIKEKGFEQIEYTNTALAAKYVSEKGDKSIAAIASEEAAEIFGLTVLEKNINASRSNTTRFAVFSRAEDVRRENEKGVHTILLFTVRNEAGALAKAIDVIGKHGFNMISLRSRPMKDLLWQYYFYVEAEGNVNTPSGKNMMLELHNYCDKLKSVGTYLGATT